MARTVSITTRKRGFFGHVFRAMFFLWNLAMAGFTLFYWILLSDAFKPTNSTAENAGATLGGFVGTGFILMVWFVGLIVFGGLMMMTRGKLVTVTESR